MNEKGLQILEQYDIQLQRSFGGRGSLMLETDQGLKLLKEFAGSRHKLPLEQRILKRLEEQGVCRTDRAVANREGELISIGEYETPYILKSWPPGRECDPRNEEDLLRSMRTLARIHRELRGAPGLSGEEKRKLTGTERSLELGKHNRELRRAQSFIRGRHRKGSFELLYLKCAEGILENGRQALKRAESAGFPGALWKSLPGGAHLPRGVYPPQYPDQPAGDGGGELPAL